MSEVKIFRINGEIKKPNYATPFKKEILSVSDQNAVERVYKEIGSKHRVKRFQIRILKVEQISLEEVTDPVVRKVASGEKT